ncbi:DUF882 domain-containing protein [Ancylobacter sp. TS-1]|nr:DUF882 domain-containing protein [Ancylobacter sp. TS-1]
MTKASLFGKALRGTALATVATLATLCGTTLLQDAVANGDTRTLTLHHVHSGASATVTFKKNGRYDPAALKQLNVLLQDWRRKEPTRMDPQLFDIVWEVYREVDATQPIEVIGGYRSPETNSMLRARSRGVAQTSLHMQGRAMDFYIPGVPLAKIREAGLRLQRGGVGFYPTSGSPFVHLDTGGVRHWPRMSRPELARVFPSGKTVHVPADGKPMSGYALALAEVESRGSEPGGAGAAFAGLSGGNDPKRAGKPAKNLFASLFSKDDDDEEAAPAAAAATEVAEAPASGAAATSAPAQVATKLAAADPVPLPQPNPLPRNVVAAAPAPAAPAAGRADLAALAAAIPLPQSRTGAAAPAAGAVVAAAVPMPQARPSEAGGLPELIVRGTGGQGPALAYADASGSIFAPERLQPGRAPAPPAGSAEAGRQMPASAAAAARNKPRAHSAEMLAEIRSLFSGPAVARNASLHTPELRRFAAFVAPPRQVVVTHFGDDASNGLSTTRFSGAAIVAVPVVAMVSGPAPLKNPL